MLNDSPRDAPGAAMAVCVCVCVCVCVYVCASVCFQCYCLPPLSQSLVRLYFDMLGSQRCSRDCSGVLVVASLEGARGVLSRFDCVYSGYITLIHSRVRRGCSGGLL